MKKLLITVVLSTVTLSGCQAIKDNPGLAVATAAVAGAGIATAINNHKHHDNDDKKDQDEYRYERSRHHRNHNRDLPMCDFSKSHMKTPCLQGDGEVYR